jgi:Carboxypeptidase regulatory-like domain/TonB-dependent Receptor Plug Domain
MARYVWLFAALLLPAGVRDACAQAVRGQLIDADSKRPVAQAILSLRAFDSTVVATATSDAEGRWHLSATQRGVYHISVRRLGYHPMVSPALTLGGDAVVPMDLRLQPMPVALAAVNARAVAVRRNLEYNGFFDRQKGNFGHFVSPEDIERRQPSRITDLLTAIPGVQLMPGRGGTVGAAQIGLRGSSVTDGALCRPRVYVDGVMYTRGDSRTVRARSSDANERADAEQRIDEALSLDDIGHPSTIAGIEVYRSATQVPVRFGGTSVETLCGVIVIWTHTGRTPERPPESSPARPR